MADDAIPDILAQTGITGEHKLKYLEFLHAAALRAVSCVTTLYTFAKLHSGPLKNVVESVESTLKTVVGPVYEKLHDVPEELLEFVDGKVDEYVSKVKNATDGVVKTASGLATKAMIKYGPTAMALYMKYAPVAEQYAVSAWESLNKLPFFPIVAHIVIPVANFCAEVYNKIVEYAAEKGYKVASFLPLIPTEKIAKIFGSKEA